MKVNQFLKRYISVLLALSWSVTSHVSPVSEEMLSDELGLVVDMVCNDTIGSNNAKLLAAFYVDRTVGVEGMNPALGEIAMLLGLFAHQTDPQVLSIVKARLRDYHSQLMLKRERVAYGQLPPVLEPQDSIEVLNSMDTCYESLRLGSEELEAEGADRVRMASSAFGALSVTLIYFKMKTSILSSVWKRLTREGGPLFNRIGYKPLA